MLDKRMAKFKWCLQADGRKWISFSVTGCQDYEYESCIGADISGKISYHDEDNHNEHKTEKSYKLAF